MSAPREPPAARGSWPAIRSGRRRPQQRLGQLAAQAFEDLLAVVDDEQCVGSRQLLAQRVDERSATSSTQPECAGHRVRHHVAAQTTAPSSTHRTPSGWRSAPRQRRGRRGASCRNPPAPMSVTSRASCAGPGRTSAISRVAADERGEPGRGGCWHRVERAQRRELVARGRDGTSCHTRSGRPEVLQAVRSQVT